MIIQSLAKNIRKQNWFTVIIEFIIVVVGIFVALQVENWNEDRAALNQTKDYLAKKLVNLDEDLKQLQALSEYRLELGAMCTNLLDKGYDNASDNEIVTLTLIVTVERRFNSSLTNAQRDSITTYFKNISGTGIEDLEQDYMNLVNFITFTEGRLNTFSESLEEDLWRSGLFMDNRELFRSMEPFSKNDFDPKQAPALKRNVKYATKSLMAILRRNEISSGRLVENYAALMKINNELQAAIKSFLKLN